MCFRSPKGYSIFLASCTNIYSGTVSFDIHRNLQKICKLPHYDVKVKAAVSATFVGNTYWFGFNQLCKNLTTHLHYDVDELLRTVPFRRSLVAQQMLLASCELGTFITVLNRLYMPRFATDHDCVVTCSAVVVSRPKLLDQELTFHGELQANDNELTFRTLSSRTEKTCSKNAVSKEDEGLHAQSPISINAGSCSSALRSSDLKKSYGSSNCRSQRNASVEQMSLIVNATSQLELNDDAECKIGADGGTRPAASEDQQCQLADERCLSNDDLFSNCSEDFSSYKCACSSRSAKLADAPIDDLRVEASRLLQKEYWSGTKSSGTVRLLMNSHEETGEDLCITYGHQRTTLRCCRELPPACRCTSVLAAISSVQTTSSVHVNTSGAYNCSFNDMYSDSGMNCSDELFGNSFDIVPRTSERRELLTSTPIKK